MSDDTSRSSNIRVNLYINSIVINISNIDSNTNRNSNTNSNNNNITVTNR
jgi:hypothetical protein